MSRVEEARQLESRPDAEIEHVARPLSDRGERASDVRAHLAWLAREDSVVAWGDRVEERARAHFISFAS
jgi:hypothetical protein